MEASGVGSEDSTSSRRRTWIQSAAPCAHSLRRWNAPGTSEL